MMQEAVSGSASARPAVDAVVAAPFVHVSRFVPTGPVVQAAPARSGLGGPLIGALCCLGIILFAIAATIVLSLIPIYINARKAAPASQTVNLLLPLSTGRSLTFGALNANQRAILQSYLQRRLNSVPGAGNARITVLSARLVPSGSGTALQVVAVINDATPSVTRRFINLVNGEPLPLDIIQALTAAGVTSTTITSTTVTSTTATTTTTTSVTTILTTTNSTTGNSTTTIASGNSTRALVRRSLDEGGAPAGILYIDSHQIAVTQGTVTTVSFYVDRTCAKATVEFGAFDLLDRNTDTNEAQLILTHRSGALKLPSAKELKPYMNLITIQLCDKDAITTANGGICKGNKFPVDSHQYIGVRSDTCRLGFAPTPSNTLYATTWKPQDVSDPLAEPYQSVKYVSSEYTVLHSVIIEPTAPSTNRQPIKQDKSTETNSPRVLFVGSYPPRRCGLAKFLEDLTDSYPGPHNVVAVDEQGADLAARDYSEKVIFRLNQTDRDAYLTLADLINTGAYDVINVQHEYGLFGGMYGEYVVSLLSSVRKPIITTFHTIIPDPNLFVISLTRAVCALSTRVVVLANLGRRLLIDVYGIDESKIVVILHGVPDVPFDHSLADDKEKLGLDPNAPTMTTFGLMHRNKNIEVALKAMQTVVKTVPNMTYLVIGQTHPIVQKYEGEAYRRELEGNVAALGLTNNVRFIDKFVDNNELLSYLGASDIFLTPYAREDQYVSGTLSWAVGLGKVVVSTPYLYAKELLSGGRGFLVPFNDDASMGSMITNVVQDDTIRNAARQKAYKYGRRMAWPHIAKELEELFREELLSA